MLREMAVRANDAEIGNPNFRPDWSVRPAVMERAPCARASRAVTIRAMIAAKPLLTIRCGQLRGILPPRRCLPGRSPQ